MGKSWRKLKASMRSGNEEYAKLIKFKKIKSSSSRTIFTVEWSNHANKKIKHKEHFHYDKNSRTITRYKKQGSRYVNTDQVFDPKVAGASGRLKVFMDANPIHARLALNDSTTYCHNDAQAESVLQRNSNAVVIRPSSKFQKQNLCVLMHKNSNGQTDRYLFKYNSKDNSVVEYNDNGRGECEPLEQRISLSDFIGKHQQPANRGVVKPQAEDHTNVRLSSTPEASRSHTPRSMNSTNDPNSAASSPRGNHFEGVSSQSSSGFDPGSRTPSPRHGDQQDTRFRQQTSSVEAARFYDRVPEYPSAAPNEIYSPAPARQDYDHPSAAPNEIYSLAPARQGNVTYDNALRPAPKEGDSLDASNGPASLQRGNSSRNNIVYGALPQTVQYGQLLPSPKVEYGQLLPSPKVEYGQLLPSPKVEYGQLLPNPDLILDRAHGTYGQLPPRSQLEYDVLPPEEPDQSSSRPLPDGPPPANDASLVSHARRPLPAGNPPMTGSRRPLPVDTNPANGVRRPLPASTKGFRRPMPSTRAASDAQNLAIQTKLRQEYKAQKQDREAQPETELEQKLRARREANGEASSPSNMTKT